MPLASGGDAGTTDPLRNTTTAGRAARTNEAGPVSGPPDEAISPAQPGRLSRGLVALLALAAGAAVANLYYIQPLLTVVGRALRVSDGAAGLLVTCAQIGYVVGLAFLVPIGDIVERRRLISTILLGTAAAAAACAAAPSFGVLAAALIALGALSVVAQVIVPLASTLAAPHERGQVVGMVMSGLLVGILMARTLSGLVAALGGWRLVFALAAAAMAVLSVTLRRVLPSVAPTERVRYRAVLRSVVTLIAQEPLLRQRMALGALHFAVFSVLWTTIAFLLGSAPYHYGTAVIGLFGLAGAAGALVAPLAGRLGDRGHGQLGFGVFLALLLLSWGLLALGRTSLVALIAGIVVLDMGVQGAHISNQTVIYRLADDARSRLTTAYMVAVFLGGVVGSTLSAVVYTSDGWTATCALGAGFAACASVIFTATRRLGSGAGQAGPPST
jgi:predicted MFS family arabinose efflux permease